MIGIVNYGLGNVGAIANIYRRKNVPVSIVSTPAELRSAERLVLPGVGAFDHAMEQLNRSGLREPLSERVVRDRVPVLGICVGMQMLAASSEEGTRAGLGWIAGRVRRFEMLPREGRMLPHMGWNDVRPTRSSPLFAALETDARFYFLHSYYFVPDEPRDTLATTSYGEPYASSVGRANIAGVQFHPEKSHQWGIQLLLNFARFQSCSDPA